jgi:hypothetical protein
MTTSDLIVVTPWIVFGAVLAAVCIRLAWRTRAPRGRCGRGDVPAAPLPPSAGQDAPGPQTQETRCPQNNAPAQR